MALQRLAPNTVVEVVVEAENVKRDPVEQLAFDVGAIVEFFGPDATRNVQAAMENDALNMKQMESLKAELLSLGHVQEADEIVDQTHLTLKVSMGLLVKIRRHASTMAQNLLDLPECLDSPEECASLLEEVSSVAAQAFASQHEGSEVYERAATRLRGLMTTFQERQLQAAKEADACDKRAQNLQESSHSHKWWAAAHGSASAVSGSGTAACATATTGAVAMTSLMSTAGAAVGTTVAAAEVGGSTMAVLATGGEVIAAGVGGSGLVPGLLNVGARVAFFCGPTGILIGSGMTIFFGAMCLYNLKKSYEDGSQADAEQKASLLALKDKRQNLRLANDAKRLADATGKTSKMLDYHKEMWGGISMSADEVKSTLATLSSTRTPTSDRMRHRFGERMKTLGEQMVYFVQAIDKYIYWLSKTNYFPPTFNVRSIMGAKAYNQMQMELGLEPTMIPTNSRKSTFLCEYANPA